MLIALRVFLAVSFLSCTAVKPPQTSQLTQTKMSSDRYIYGCGVSWGSWGGLGRGDQAKIFDAQSLDMIKAMGGVLTGANLAWIDIQPNIDDDLNDDALWDYTDSQVQAAFDRGLRIRAYIGVTPKWAVPETVKKRYLGPDGKLENVDIGYRVPPLSPMYLDSNLTSFWSDDEKDSLQKELADLKDEKGRPDPYFYEKKFKDFLKAAATRYKGKIQYYHFGNEPNGCSWMRNGCSNGDDQMAAAYYYWMKLTYQVVKAIDPEAMVGTAGIDYHAGNANGFKWLETLYRLEKSDPSLKAGEKTFDAVTIHPYGQSNHNDPNQRLFHWRALDDTLNMMRGRNDLRPIWIGEYGWNYWDDSLNKLNLEERAIEREKREEIKAANLREVLPRLKNDYPEVQLASYLVITDLPHTKEHENHFDYGLCNRDRQSPTAPVICDRASYKAFKDIAARP